MIVVNHLHLTLSNGIVNTLFPVKWKTPLSPNGLVQEKVLLLGLKFSSNNKSKSLKLVIEEDLMLEKEIKKLE